MRRSGGGIEPGYGQWRMDLKVDDVCLPLIRVGHLLKIL